MSESIGFNWSLGRLPDGPPSAATSGRVLGDRYRLLGELGRGGMGVVFRARDQDSGRDVAVKLLVAEELGDAQRQRFQREGQLTATLDHPGIVRVHAAGEDGGTAYLVYELVEGARTLDQVFPELDRRRRVECVRDLARALGYAHARGVVHRDVKPPNVLVDSDGRVRLADFGLAVADGASRLTRSGAMPGTPSYMAPEQLMGEAGKRGPPVDVWATGVILYTALSGEHPFSATSWQELAVMVANAQPPALRRFDATVPRGLEAICLQALAKTPAQRYPHGDALADDLDAWLEGRPVRARQPGRAGRLLAVSLALTLAIAFGLAAAVGPGQKGVAAASTAPVASEPASGQEGALPAAEQPDWYREAAQRPAFPLPHGIEFGQQVGEYLHTSDGSVLVWVPAGIFSMGEDVLDRGPVRRVTLTQGFFLGKYELRLEQFDRFSQETGYPRTDRSGWTRRDLRLPVVEVSQFDALAYLEWAGLRLPTEAEWEYAAGGARGWSYPWGTEPVTGKEANFAFSEDSPRIRATVGLHPLDVSPFGCFDMAGNVREWVRDGYAPYDPADLIDPLGPTEGVEEFVRRGGAFDEPLQEWNVSDRRSTEPQRRHNNTGLRVALSAE